MPEVAPVAERRTEAARVEERPHTSVREYIESLLVTVILALFGTTFVAQAFKIPSQSMEPTLIVGEHLGGKVLLGSLLTLSGMLVSEIWGGTGPSAVEA